jgi:cysteinyl-tRNA synthetase
MALHYLGPEFDIHGGGADLIFPHHENEIAQAESYTGKPFARFWVHNGFITVLEEKMSKSQGNFFLVRELLQHFSGAALRFFLLTTHYRNPLDFAPEKVEEVKRGWERLLALARALTTRGNAPDSGKGATSPEDADPLARAAAACREKFLAAMDDDCNTALAIAVLFDFARTANGLLQEPVKVTAAGLMAARRILKETAGEILGILPQEGGQAVPAAAEETTAGLVDLVLEWRRQARAQRDWATADRLRQRLNELGVVVEDTPTGTRWRYASNGQVSSPGAGGWV